MSADNGDSSGRRRGPTGPSSSGSQGASRGGFHPDELDSSVDRPHGNERSDDDPGAGWGSRRQASGGGAPFGGFPFGGGQRGGGGPRFLGLPVTLIYAMGAALLLIVFVGAVCGSPATRTGTVAGQVKALNADRSVATLPGAQVTLHGSGGPYTTTSTDVDPNAEGEAAYNYRIENVPAGTYSMSVAPPTGGGYQPEESISVEVKDGQLFPQSVMLLANGIQKPRQLTQNELQPGEAGGYVNERGERVVYQQGGGFDASDALLMYLLWRNPPGWGYGAPPIIYGGGGVGSTGSSYRVADPPTRSSSGQAVTQRPPAVPGQGSTRPSSGTGATGAGPSYSSGSRDSDAAAPSQSKPSTSSGSSGSSSSTSTQTKPSTSTGGGSTTVRPNTPSQGASRPSSSTSRPSSSSSSGSRSSGGGRR
jgi:hypothetical protein